MSGKGDGFSASSVDLLRSDFRTHSNCNSGLSSLQWCSAGHLPIIFPWLSPLLLIFVPFRRKADEGKAVSERRRCPSILRRCHFGHTPVNVVWCHRQLVWEDGQICTGWGGFLRKTGVDRLAVSVVVKPDCKTLWVTLVLCGWGKNQTDGWYEDSEAYMEWLKEESDRRRYVDSEAYMMWLKKESDRSLIGG